MLVFLQMFHTDPFIRNSGKGMVFEYFIIPGREWPVAALSVRITVIVNK